MTVVYDTYRNFQYRPISSKIQRTSETLRVLDVQKDDNFKRILYDRSCNISILGLVGLMLLT